MWKVLAVYYRLNNQVRKRNANLDSTYQLIIICKYLWIVFSWLLAVGFVIYTKYNEESDEFFDSLELSREQFVFKTFLFVNLIMLGYHFIPVIRKQSILIQKHHPYSTVERFVVNFIASSWKLSIINILGIWVIFYFGNRNFFQEYMLVHALLQLLGVSILIFNIKELFLWTISKMIIYFVFSVLLLGAFLYSNTQPFDYLVLYDILVLSFSIGLSLLTEHNKIEQNEHGSYRTNNSSTFALMTLPFRVNNLFNVIKFVVTFELIPLLSYNFLLLDIFKKIMYLTMMVPLTLMTNYGNNAFGFAKQVSTNLFHRTFSNKILFLTYLQLVSLPFIVCYVISVTFFLVYSSHPLQDLVGYTCVSIIYICIGFTLALRNPVVVNEVAWFSSGQQSRQSLFISSGIAALWLILINVSFLLAIFCGIITLAIIAFVYLKSEFLLKSVNLFRDRFLTSVKA